MDYKQLEYIILEEVKKVLAEQNRGDETLLPPNQNETLDPNACRGPVCSISNTPAVAPQEIKKPIVTSNQSKPVSTPKRDGLIILCIFSGAQENWDVLKNAFQTWHQNGIYLDAVFSSSAREIISPDEIKSLGFRIIEDLKELHKLMYDMKQYAAVILPSISRNHAAKLALGITDNLTLNLSLSALAQGIPTFASDEGLAPTACIVCGNHVPGIQDVLNNYRQQLAKMGMKLSSAEELATSIQTRLLYASENNNAELISSVITEQEAAQLNGPVIKVSRGGLITPLALELLQKRGIEVVIVPKKS